MGDTAFMITADSLKEAAGESSLQDIRALVL
eukprot:SAG11_NODE_37768_length_255_cov_0.903846_1_plen_30_part_10